MTPLVLDLPMPPSVNAIWRSRRGTNGKPMFYLDHKYKAWKLECDGIYMATRPKVRFRGPVKVDIILSRAKRRGDTDNRQKALLDFLQRAEIVANDSQVEDVRARWGEAPSGCRVTVEILSGHIADSGGRASSVGVTDTVLHTFSDGPVG